MLDLIWKDFVTTRLFLAIALPLYVLQLMATLSAPPLFLFITFVFTGLLTFGVLGIEEAQGTDALWCSLPVSRADLVVARYLSMLLSVILGLGTSWSVGQVTSFWWSVGRHGALLRDPSLYATLFFAFLVVGAAFLPCYFRFGAGRCLLVFALSTFGLVVLVLAGCWLLSALGIVAGDELVGLGTSPEFAIDRWTTLWSKVLAVVLVAVSLLIAALSAVLSERLCSKRDY